MHFEILTEDSSGEKLFGILLPKILGEYNSPHTWKIHGYKGIGRIPSGMNAAGDPSKRILLDQLPRILRGYGKTPGIDAVVVVADSDARNCIEFLDELRKLLQDCNPAPRTLFRLAIEELEAWYFGDHAALAAAYPRAKKAVLDRYIQDGVCGTWECLADAIHPRGSKGIKEAGWPLPGQIKHEWAKNIGPHLDVDRNVSPSFNKMRDGLRRMTG